MNLLLRLIPLRIFLPSEILNFADGKSETGTLYKGIEFHKPFEYAINFLFGNPETCITYIEIFIS